MLFVLAALTGCAQPNRGPLERPGAAGQEPASLEVRIEEQRARAEGRQDPWPFYELALLYEEAGDAPKAIQAYGSAINRLEPRTWTSPMFRLGLLHHRAGNVDAAARCFREVVATIAGDSTKYRTNPDFQQAALGLKAIAEQQGQPVPDALHERFVRDFGGTEAEWQAGPPWLKKADSPAPRSP